MLSILQAYEVLSKIGHVTYNNASINDSVLSYLAVVLREMKIKVEPRESMLRYFCNIRNHNVEVIL